MTDYSDTRMPFKSPDLLPGDVRSLVTMLNIVLNSDLSLPYARRMAVESTMNRLGGQDGQSAPDLPRAMASWLATLASGDHEDIAREGAKALEVAYLCGDPDAADALHAAMEECATKIESDRKRGPETAADGPGGEKGNADGIDWYDPDPARFYVLGGAHGDAMRELTDDLAHADRYVARDIDAPTRLLFVGDPGNGKTEGAKHIGARLGKPVALFRLAKIGSSYINRTSRNLAACFEEAERRGAIILIDELNGLGTRRDTQGPGASEGDKRVIDALTQTFDALSPAQIVIGCTNLPDAIDPAIAGRLVRHVNFGPPDAETRRAIVSYHWRNMVWDVDTVSRIVDLTSGRSGRSVRFAAHDAARRAIRADRDEITMADVHAAMIALPRDGKLAESRILGAS